jgi:sulfite reductase (NADPH) hemoprotein beta-component
MVGGGVQEDGARFGRLAAKVPARRIPEALDRLLALFSAQRREAETARAFFQRVDLQDVKAALGDLDALAPEGAGPEDFVDLGEEAEFKVEAMEGECSA